MLQFGFENSGKSALSCPVSNGENVRIRVAEGERGPNDGNSNDRRGATNELIETGVRAYQCCNERGSSGYTSDLKRWRSNTAAKQS